MDRSLPVPSLPVARFTSPHPGCWLSSGGRVGWLLTGRLLIQSPGSSFALHVWLCHRCASVCRNGSLLNALNVNVTPYLQPIDLHLYSLWLLCIEQWCRCVLLWHIYATTYIWYLLTLSTKHEAHRNDAIALTWQWCRWFCFAPSFKPLFGHHFKWVNTHRCRPLEENNDSGHGCKMTM